jgi:hypothetical protein
MFKSLAGYFTAAFVVGPLIALLVPLFYGLLCMLAFALPLAFLLSTIEDVRDGTVSIRSEEVLTKFLLASIVVPIGFIAVAAPLRALLMAMLSFFPEWMGKFNAMHSYVFDWFSPFFGDLSAYWVDVSWGLLGAGTIFLIALADSIRRNRLTRQIEVLPTSKVRSVAIGLVELKGKAVSLKNKGSKAPIIREWRESTGDGASLRRTMSPFLLDDGTGRILVDPADIFIKTEKMYFSVGLHQAILREFHTEKGLTETRLMPGDQVYVVGNVQSNKDPKLSRYGDIVVKPKKSSLLSMNFYDLFFLSNVSEEALLDGFRKSVQRGWQIIILIIALGAWLSVFSFTNILQIQASRIDAAPDYLRAVTTPTTLEREIKVVGVGREPTIRFVEMLEEGDYEKSAAIMAKFEELELTAIALPILKEQARNIDHPGFGVANAWISKLGKQSRDEWGIEFLDRGSRHPNQSRVLRLRTRYKDNRLFVSYRAFISEKMVTRLHVIQRRDVIIKLVNIETGKSYETELATQPGVNAVNDVQAFEFLYPGLYELEAYVKTSFQGGPFILGSRNRKPVKIRLEE